MPVWNCRLSLMCPIVKSMVKLMNIIGIRCQLEIRCTQVLRGFRKGSEKNRVNATRIVFIMIRKSVGLCRVSASIALQEGDSSVLELDIKVWESFLEVLKVLLHRHRSSEERGPAGPCRSGCSETTAARCCSAGWGRTRSGPCASPCSTARPSKRPGLSRPQATSRTPPKAPTGWRLACTCSSFKPKRALRRPGATAPSPPPSATMLWRIRQTSLPPSRRVRTRGPAAAPCTRWPQRRMVAAAVRSTAPRTASDARAWNPSH